LSNQNPPSQQQNQLSLDQLIEMINNTRDDILRTQSSASTTSITGYDGLTKHLQSCVTQMGNQEKEIIRLQELCKKHNIDYAIPPVQETVPQVIAPHPSTQEISNPPVSVNEPVEIPETSKS